MFAPVQTQQGTNPDSVPLLAKYAAQEAFNPNRLQFGLLMGHQFYKVATNLLEASVRSVYFAAGGFLSKERSNEFFFQWRATWHQTKALGISTVGVFSPAHAIKWTKAFHEQLQANLPKSNIDSVSEETPTPVKKNGPAAPLVPGQQEGAGSGDLSPLSPANDQLPTEPAAAKASSTIGSVSEGTPTPVKENDSAGPLVLGKQEEDGSRNVSPLSQAADQLPTQPAAAKASSTIASVSEETLTHFKKNDSAAPLVSEQQEETRSGNVSPLSQAAGQLPTQPAAAKASSNTVPAQALDREKVIITDVPVPPPSLNQEALAQAPVASAEDGSGHLA